MAWLTALDHQLFFTIHHLQKYKLDLLLAWPTHFGSLWFALPILFLLTLLQSSSRLIPRALAASMPVIIARLGTDILKVLFERPRPFSVFASDPDAVKVIFDPPSSFSFPSGHASTAFSVAVILVTWFGVPRTAAYSFAILICLTRLYLGVHFPSDILAGAIWGFAIALLWTKTLKARGFVWQKQA